MEAGCDALSSAEIISTSGSHTERAGEAELEAQIAPLVARAR